MSNYNNNGLATLGPVDRQPSRPQKRYLVIEDTIRSSNDNQLHFISCPQLMALYRVDPEECVCLRSIDSESYALAGYERHQLITLRPRADGVYSLQEAIREHNVMRRA